MIRESALTTVSWKRYLIDDGSNPRVKKFLQSRGDSVFNQISSQVKEAALKGKPYVMFIVHPNIGNAIIIKKNEYITLLNTAIEWFEKREKYEKCAQIRKWITTMNGKKERVSDKVENNIFI